MSLPLDAAHVPRDGVDVSLGGDGGAGDALYVAESGLSGDLAAAEE